jgi:eukaryotic-like serine/threonine-protein kinase
VKGTLLAGRYRLKERVAAGGMGTVWKAEDELLKRPVAVKLLQDGFVSDPVMAERFRREALLAASVSHPNMADVFDYIEEDGHPGIVMELVEAETLAQRLSRAGALSIEEGVRLGAGILAALQAAHDAGIVHRDIKPANIILAPGRVKVTDFGIARATGDATLTHTGTMMGTAHYAAPEQVRGDAATPASDIYAVGVLLYEALTGQRPFAGETPLAAAAARLSEDPPSPRSVRKEIPEALERVVLVAMARDPTARFRSAREMHEALEQSAEDAPSPGPATAPMPAADDHTVALPIAAPAEVVGRPARRGLAVRSPEARRAMAGVAVAVLVLAVVLIALLSRSAGSVVVPDFRGMQASQARVRAAQIGLEVQTRTRDADAPAGRVLAQSVDAGSKVRRNTTVTLTVASGTPSCCVVPTLRGLSRSDAISALATVRLAIGRTNTVSTDAEPAGTVLAQDPPAGTRLQPGGSVDLVVAGTPPRSDEGNDEGGGGHGKGNRKRG